MDRACELKRRFRVCGARANGLCQYCGRAFCPEHGWRLDDGQEICSRSVCRRKKEDLEQHFAYKEAVGKRNQRQLCGSDCEERPAGECSKCGGLYCYRHLEERELEQRRGSTVVRVRGSLCRHCNKRRRLWSRT